ncbi:uncharacterized protein DDB_G0287625-like [Temnothorax curvispinosus]|uniref:Uncharacterized protein DDB_G0287625-like n=1 Tax=Temnothorax curvispinosus TaxID=300111 RepID=A0A6J1QG19_9HYME|nr:uncharacterized protein DDB_G0287625-like [Temnothorax curvispinosus]
MMMFLVRKLYQLKGPIRYAVQPHEESDVDNNKEVEEMDSNSSESRNSYGSSTDNSDDGEIEKEKLIRQLSAKLDITMLRKLANKDATETTSSKASSLLAQLSSSSHDYLDAENSFGNGSHDSSNPSRSNGQEVKSNKPENLGNVNNGPNNLPDPSIVDQQPINAFHEDMSINTCNVNPPINDDNKQNVGNDQIQIYTITNPERVSKINSIVPRYKS